MADPNLKVSVLVQLVDRLTAPLRGLTRGIGATANAVANLGRRIGVVGGALAALSFTAPLQQAAAWDAQLRDIAITAGKVGSGVEQMIGELSTRYQKLAFDTGQASMDVAKGAQLLIAAGMDPTLIDKLLPTIAKVATATGATIEDTAKTAFSLSETLRVPADQMEAMLGKLVTAGKLGRFEFRDMAREFPELTAQMAKFGIKGTEAVETLGSSLQIAMLGTANPGQAATNLNNFLTKVNAPEAIKKFEKELNVDVTGVMTDAAAKGINPVEAVLQKMMSKLKPQQAELDKIMKKAGISDKEREKQVQTLLEGTKVGKLYADMQVLGFLLPFMQNLEKYKDFKRQLQEAGVGVIIDDFASRMRGLEPQMKQFGVVMNALGNRIGLAFASNMPFAMKAIQDLLKWIDTIDKRWPGLIDGVLSWTGALLVLGAGIAILTPVFSALAAAIALLISPIGLIIVGLAALAAGAVYVWQNWETLGPKLSALWDSIASAFSSAWESIKSGQALDAAISWVKTKVQELVPAILEALPGMIESGGKLIAAIGDGLAQGLVAIAAFGLKIVVEIGRAVIANVNVLTAAGAQLIGALTDAAEKKFWEFIEWCRGIPGRIVAAIGNIDLSNVIKWPTLPAWLGGGSAAPRAPGATGGTGVDPMGNPTGTITPGSAPGGGLGGSAGFTRTAGGPASNSNVNVGGRIVVEAAEGSRIVNVQSENPAVPVTPNRGTMLGRA
ncbi:phage tail tape measure protein [Bosea sp. TND4EK4]|uniref:phage tail tape measure protein n=1 Tax=Bosea sp. TND4EK4 TaxID=1907408 RepID=UPI0009550ADE|nr:phage tail tape measure protein [Bosea sp. TND4EK4]SIP96256.1 phage tail tape measure protein, TP901 family, core region [Bosea sp. TND4EK4]